MRTEIKNLKECGERRETYGQSEKEELKKINAEMKMSDAELDQVAGGDEEFPWGKYYVVFDGPHWEVEPFKSIGKPQEWAENQEVRRCEKYKITKD